MQPVGYIWGLRLCDVPQFPIWKLMFILEDLRSSSQCPLSWELLSAVLGSQNAGDCYLVSAKVGSLWRGCWTRALLDTGQPSGTWLFKLQCPRSLRRPVRSTIDPSLDSLISFSQYPYISLIPSHWWEKQGLPQLALGVGGWACFSLKKLTLTPPGAIPGHVSNLIPMPK